MLLGEGAGGGAWEEGARLPGWGWGWGERAWEEGALLLGRAWEEELAHLGPTDRASSCRGAPAH